MAIKNIQMNMLNESTDYDILWPETDYVLIEGSRIGTGVEGDIEISLPNILTGKSLHIIGFSYYNHYHSPAPFPSISRITTTSTNLEIGRLILQESYSFIACPDGENIGSLVFYEPNNFNSYNYLIIKQSGNKIIMSVEYFNNEGDIVKNYETFKDCFNRKNVTNYYMIFGVWITN